MEQQKRNAEGYDGFLSIDEILAVQRRRDRRFWLVMWVLAIAGIGLMAFALWSGRAQAHEAPSGMVYDGYCCNGNAHTGDCHPIPDDAVKVIPGGYQITLQAGDHPLVTRLHVFQKAQSETRWSTDGQYHACLYPNEDTLRCFYAPPPGV